LPEKGEGVEKKKKKKGKRGGADKPSFNRSFRGKRGKSKGKRQAKVGKKKKKRNMGLLPSSQALPVARKQRKGKTEGKEKRKVRNNADAYLKEKKKLEEREVESKGKKKREKWGSFRPTCEAWRMKGRKKRVVGEGRKKSKGLRRIPFLIHQVFKSQFPNLSYEEGERGKKGNGEGGEGGGEVVGG